MFFAPQCVTLSRKLNCMVEASDKDLDSNFGTFALFLLPASDHKIIFKVTHLNTYIGSKNILTSSAEC